MSTYACVLIYMCNIYCVCVRVCVCAHAWMWGWVDVGVCMHACIVCVCPQR